MRLWLPLLAICAILAIVGGVWVNGEVAPIGVRNSERVDPVHSVGGRRSDINQFVSIVTGIILLGYGLYLGYDRYDFVRHSMISVGTVESCKVERNYKGRLHRRIKIVFKPYQGKRVRFQMAPWASQLMGATFYVGQEVGVRYDYRNPRKAFVFSWAHIWGGADRLVLCGARDFVSRILRIKIDL